MLRRVRLRRADLACAGRRCSSPAPSLALGAPRRRPPAAAAPGAAHLRPGEGPGQAGRLGPELRHDAPARSRCRAATPAVRRAVDGRRQRRRDRAGRHQGHDHRRAVPGPARPAPADVLREHAGATRAWPRSARPRRSTSTTSRRTTSCTGARSKLVTGEGERRARRRRRGQGRRDQGRDRGQGVRVVRRPGPDHRVRRGARGPRRAVRRRLPDRRAAVVPRAARAVHLADARVTRAGERALGRVRRHAARAASKAAYAGDAALHDEDAPCSASSATTTTRARSRKSVAHFEQRLGVVPGEAGGDRAVLARPRRPRRRTPAT